jgi:serine protease Do
MNRFFGTAVVGLIGAILGSFSMMLFASTHFTNVAGPGNTPPALAAAPLTSSGGSDQERIVNAVKRVEPSVVSLLVTVNGTRMVPADPLSQFFGGQGQGPTTRQRFQERASGSGFVYRSNGLIITNNHVVPKGTSKITVVFANGDHVAGHVYSQNPAVDLALVKVDNYAKLPPPIEFSDSTKLNAGQWAIAVGEPFELKQSVSVGVVSGFNRDEPIQDEQTGGYRLFRGMLQTSAPINPGNSGGPLVDDQGRLIGVNQSTANPQAAQGIGFAIPSNLVRDTAKQLENSQGKTIDATGTGTGVGYLGVALGALNNNTRAQINYPASAGTGAVVMQIPPNGPAAKVDLSPGDVIQKIDDKVVTKPEDVIQAIKAMKPGTTVKLQVWSAGTKKLIVITLGEQPADIYLQQKQQQNQ